MTIQQLQSLKQTDLINIRSLCKKAELNYDTVYAKIRRGTELSKFESFALSEALSEEGIKYKSD